MLTKDYLIALLNNFNKKTGLEIDQNLFYADLHFINDDKAGDEKKGSFFQDVYEMTFLNLISSYKRSYYQNNAPEVKANFMQEFDAMMNHIYFKCCNGQLDYNVKFNYGYLSSTGKGLAEREYEFRKNINKSTDIEADLLRKNQYNEDKIISNLKLHTERFNPQDFYSNQGREENAAKLEDLAANLKVARNHYKKKNFFMQWISFGERKAINQAKAKIKNVLLHSNPKTTDKDLEKYLDSLIPASTKCKNMEDSLNNNNKIVKGVTHYEQFQADYIEEQEELLRNDGKKKEPVKEEIIEEIKKPKYKFDPVTNKFSILDTKDYNKFLKNNKFTKTNSTDKQRHEAYMKYCDSLDANVTTEKAEINNEDLESDINTNININDLFENNNKKINKEIQNNNENEIIDDIVASND